MPQTVLEFREVVKRFGTVAVVDQVSFAIQSGEIFALLGSSGCGKTTTLSLAAGLEEPEGGEILVNGAPVAAPRRNVFVAPDERELGMVFQNHEDEARSLIMAMIDGIHFFKTKKADTLAIIKKHCTELLRIQDERFLCDYKSACYDFGWTLRRYFLITPQPSDLLGFWLKTTKTISWT